MSTINVRYIVNNVDEAIPFYERLGFKVEMHPAPPFAALSMDGLTLYLNQPGAGGAGQSSDNGDAPSPGGWNRFQLQVPDLDATMNALRGSDLRIRTDIVQGNGGRQAVVEDPSGNPVELFEPRR